MKFKIDIELSPLDLKILRFIADIELGLRPMRRYSLVEELLENFGESVIGRLNHLEYWHLLEYREGSNPSYHLTELGKNILLEGEHVGDR